MKQFISLFVFFILSNSISFAYDNGFHYHEFKKNFISDDEELAECWYCPKEIRESKIIEIEESVKKTYAEKKYGAKVEHKNYDQIIADSKALNSHVMVGMELFDTTTTTQLCFQNYVTGTLQCQPPEVTKKSENNWSISLLTLINLKYFGATTDPGDVYLETRLGKNIDMFVLKDFLDGKTGAFYLMGGIGLRVNLSAEAGEMVAPVATVKTGIYISDRLGLWAQLTFADSIIQEERDLLYERDNMYETGLYMGYRF